MVARPTPAASARQANKALAGMNPALVDVYESVRDLMTKAEQGNILSRWEIGSKVDAIMDDAKYGENAVEKLATALGTGTQELYRCRQFTITYEKKQVSELLQRRTESGQSITWSHIDALTRVDKTATRDALTEKVFKNSWTVRELVAEIQKKLGRRGSGRGRPRVGPKTPLAALGVINKQTQADAEIISGSMSQLAKVLDAPSDFSTDVFLAEVSEALTNAKTTSTAYGDLIRELEKVESAASRVLRAEKNRAESDKTSPQATVRASAKAKLKVSKKTAKAKKTTLKKDGQGRFWLVPKDGGNEKGPFDTKAQALASLKAPAATAAPKKKKTAKVSVKRRAAA